MRQKITLIQWLIIGALAGANLGVLGVLAFVLIKNASTDSSLPTQAVQVRVATRTQTLASTATRLVITASPTFTVTPPLVRELIATRQPLTPSRTPTAISTPLLPTQVHLTNVVGFPQLLPLSCEAHIAVVIARHYGVQIDELEFFRRLPLSDDPEAGFVGDVYGGWGQIPPNAYGVHAEPVAALLREYKVPATAWKGLTLDQLRAELAAGRPVGVWVTGHVWPGEAVQYTTEAGTVVTVAPYEHTVVVIGYTAESFLILDGDEYYYRTAEQFSKSWGVLGNMAILRGK